ncbi:uncharacterized protein LOC129960734 isoform X3 [Argiope bruennichi]|uniref:uncharacterized protein LOC129960734 isoform X3 n=1 Tax=Argiope bruennichi TaxID=94029 RepID=UPI002494F313|nr:uncharacterized protein LOC129960734 isoform X3 [Argiope bruennichi]
MPLHEDKERKTIERGNLFMDKVIETIADYEFCNDSYLLDNIEFSFERNTPYGNISLDTRLSDGHLKGLQTLDRLGPCSFFEADGRMHINAALTTGLLNVKYQGCFQFLSLLRPHFSLDVNIINVTVCLYISVNSSTGQDGILHKFFVENIQDISVNFSGLRPFNKPINFLNRGLIRIFRNHIEKKLQTLLEDHIKSKIANFTFPNKKIVYYKYKLKIPPHSQSPYKFSPLQTIEEFE